jgi:hypothetical protein
VLPDLTTNQKGAIAESAIVHAAVKQGVEVYRPLSEGGRFDYIFLVGEDLVRVQCKWAARHGDVVSVRFYSSRRTARGITRRCYAVGEIDAIAAYCPELERCYFLPFERFAGRAAVQLRLAPCRNGQVRGVNWAADYEFQARLRPAGP